MSALPINGNDTLGRLTSPYAQIPMPKGQPETKRPPRRVARFLCWLRGLGQRADHRLDALFHGRRVEWLDDVIVDAERNGFLDLLLVGAPGGHDEGHGLGAGMLADDLEQGQPVDIVHVPVRNDQVDIGLFELAQRIAPGFGLDDVLEPQLGENILGDTAHRLLVVNDQDADSACFWHGFSYLYA